MKKWLLQFPLFQSLFPPLYTLQSLMKSSKGFINHQLCNLDGMIIYLCHGKCWSSLTILESWQLSKLFNICIGILSIILKEILAPTVEIFMKGYKNSMRVSIWSNGQKKKCKLSMNRITMIVNIISKHKHKNVISKHKYAIIRIKSIDCLAAVYYKRVKRYCIINRI